MAEASIIPLTDWPNGVVLPKGSHLQEPINALRALSDAVGFDRRHPRRPLTTDWRLGMIVAAGPNGEADFTDERYWIELQAITESDSDDTLQVETDDLEQYVDDQGNNAPVVPATNLNEWQEGTHFMSQGDLVWVKGKNDKGSPSQVHWAFDTQPKRPIFVHLRLNSSPGSNGSVSAGVVTNASYLYDLLNPDTGDVIATGISPAGIREQGPLVGAAGIGMARISPGGTWTLIWCDERRAVVACP